MPKTLACFIQPPPDGLVYVQCNMADTTETRLSGVLEFLNGERQRRRLTLTDIAQAAGYVDKSAARRALESANPTLQSVLRLADAMGVTLKVTAGQDHQAVRIAVFNHAGGTGKTTLVRDMGVRMAQLGLNVLLIDLDPQANLTDWLGIDSAKVTLEETVYPALIPSKGPLSGDLKSLPEPKRVFGLDVIPSSLDLVMLETALHSQMGAGHVRMRKALDGLEANKGYDVVIVDSPPYVSQVSNLAALSVEHLVVPVTTTAKALGGFVRVRAIVESLKEQNASLRITAVVPTLYSKRVVVQDEAYEALQQVAEGIPVLSPLAHRPNPHSSSQADQLPIPIGEDRSWADAQAEIDQITGELLALVGVNVSVDEAQD